LLEEFEIAVSRAKIEPKGIRISPALWKKLNDAKLIEFRSFAGFGIFDLGEGLPCYKSLPFLFTLNWSFLD